MKDKLHLIYTVECPIDINTTDDAKKQQMDEIRNIVYKSIQLKFKENDDNIKTIEVRFHQREMSFPSVENIVKFNQESQTLFEEKGIYGVTGLKDKGIVETAINNIGKNSVIFGQDQFPTVSQKAAHLWFKLARYQAFNNGNKRTGLLAALNFLENNNYHVDYEKLNLDRNYFYNISKKIATGKWKEKDIQKFILNICESKLEEV